MSTAELFTLDPTAKATARAVVGLDLALATSGVAHSDGTTGLIKTTPDQRRTDRLIHIRDAVLAFRHVDLAVIEFLPKQVAFGGVELGMVHGVVLTALHEAGTPVLEVPPSTLKKYATGNGNANKDDIRAELIKRLDLDIRQPDERDAWVLRAIGLEMLGHPIVTMPQSHRTPLVKLVMPALRGAA